MDQLRKILADPVKRGLIAYFLVAFTWMAGDSIASGTPGASLRRILGPTVTLIGLLAGIVFFVAGAIYSRRLPQPDLEGRCESCSYLLKGNTTGICPECGTPTPRRDERAT